MFSYLVAVLAAVILQNSCPWLGGITLLAGGLWLLIRSSPPPLRFASGTVAAPRPFRPPRLALLAPLAGIALGRVLSAISTGIWNPNVLTPLAALVAFCAFLSRRDEIPRALQKFGLVLAGVAIANLALGDPSYFVHRNRLAAMLIPCLAAWLPELRRGGRWRPGALVALALVSTVSRAGMLAGLAVVAWYGGWARVALPVAVVATPLLIQLRNHQVIAWRLECWRQALGLWQSSPVFGVGPGTHIWPGVKTGIHAHNALLSALAWTGSVGGALLLAGVGVGAWAVWPARRGWAAAGLVGIVIHHLTDDFSGCAVLLALAAGLLVAAKPRPGRLIINDDVITPSQTTMPDPVKQLHNSSPAS